MLWTAQEPGTSYDFAVCVSHFVSDVDVQVLTSKNVTLPAVKIMVSGVTIRGITAIKKSSPRSKRYPAVIDVDRYVMLYVCHDRCDSLFQVCSRLDRIVIADCVIDGSWEHKPCTLAFEPKCLCGSRCHGFALGLTWASYLFI